MFYVCGFIEMLTSFAKFCNISNKAAGLSLENAGDYKLGQNFLPKDELKAKEMKLKELKNGRLAMLAFGGAVTQATLSGNGFPWLYATGKECQGAGLSSSLRPASSSSSLSSSRRGQVARRAGAEEMGYTMSKAVPFLPMSPALEGMAGEEEGFDPLGVSLAIDVRWLREAELKHARVAMLATVGWIATDLGMRVPGEPFREISTVQAHDAMVAFGSMSHMLVWFGIAEGFGQLASAAMFEGKTDRQPGDFGLRGLGYPKDAKGQREMQLKELRNGRLAMLAYGGIVTMGVLTEGEKWPFFATKEVKKTSGGSMLCGGVSTTALHVGRAASATACQATPAAAAAAPAAPAKRAFSKSMPFLPKPANLEGLAGNDAEFDPLELSTTWDVRWMQEAELKHGRVCMLATLGFVTEPFLTFPGMTSTPDATQAVYTAPIPAMAALLFIAGSIESNAYNGKINMLDMFEGEGAKRQPGDLNFGKTFLPKDKAQEMAIRTKELQNGRLAMLGIGGMIHHNIVVKAGLFPLIPDGWTGPESIIGSTPFAGGH
ncbi:unnamed protein product [Polarella glacialis]|nr:unnamed protein product [Polarella glacialis]